MKIVFSLSFINRWSNKKIKGVILTLPIFLIFSCSRDCPYPYRNNLDKFLSTEVDYKIPHEETILVLLPLDACNTCLVSTIDMLVKSRASLVVVISTTNKNNIKKFNLDQLNLPIESFHFDWENNYSRYEIGVHAPVIFHFVNRRCRFFSETTDNNHHRIKQYFGWD
jgi:hypothetical protein